MKKSHPSWAAFGFEEKPKAEPKPSMPQAPIRMLDIAGIRSLEDKLIISSPRPEAELPPELEHAANQVSREIFGVTAAETEFEWPEDAPADDWDAWEAHDQYESQFEFRNMTDDEAAEMLIHLGLDFTDEKGFPLRCIRILGRQAEAAAKKIKGKMPEPQTVATDRWARSIEADAEAFLATKRRGQL